MRKKGFALVYVLGIMFVVFVLAYALGTTGIGQLDDVFHANESEIALSAAYAGALNAVSSFQENYTPDCGNLSGANAVTGAFQDGTAHFSADVTSAVHFTGNPPPVGTPVVDASCGPITDPDGTVVPAGMLYVDSTGTAVNSASAVLATRTVKAFFSVVPGWSFPYAAFGKTVVDIGGQSGVTVNTDSYDSASHKCGKGLNGSGGNVGTDLGLFGSGSPYGLNFTTPAVLTGSPPQFTINGAATLGPGGNSAAFMASLTPPGQTITGGASTLQTRIGLPVWVEPNNLASQGDIGTDPTPVPSPTTDPSAPLAPGSYGIININSGNLYLQCGQVYAVQFLLNTNGTGPGTSTAQIVPDYDYALSNSSGCPQDQPVQVFVSNGLGIGGMGAANPKKPDANHLGGAGLFFYFFGTGGRKLGLYASGSYTAYGAGQGSSVLVNGDLTDCGAVLSQGQLLLANSTVNIYYDHELDNDPYPYMFTVNPVSAFSSP